MPLAGFSSSRRTEWFGTDPGTANTRTVGLGSNARLTGQEAPGKKADRNGGIFSRSIPLQKLFRFESSHFASKLVSIEADRLLDRATPGTSPLPPDENAYRGGNHPPYCTCAACTADRLGRISQSGPTGTAKRILRAVQRVLRLGR